MVPPWMAAQLASPAAKWLGLALVVALWSGWCYLQGRADVQQAWDASVARQAADSVTQVLAQAESTQRVMEAHAAAEQQVRAQSETVEREVRNYVQATQQPCVLDPALVRLFDAISRVPADPDGLSAADGGAGAFVDAPAAGLAAAGDVSAGRAGGVITTDELLQAYHTAVEELALLWVDYAALVQWERGRYIVEHAGWAHE